MSRMRVISTDGSGRGEEHTTGTELKLERILSFGFENNLEIVSFGLAPNVTGFCFESHGKATEAVKCEFSRMLDTLTKSEIEVLKGWVF